jgi:hypothetical protein
MVEGAKEHWGSGLTSNMLAGGAATSQENSLSGSLSLQDKPGPMSVAAPERSSI